MEPTTRLGNWTVHLVQYGRQQVVLATSDRSLLTVILPARSLRTTLEANLRDAVGALLAAMNVPAEIVQRELVEMQAITYSAAKNRSVIGSINEFAFCLGIYLESMDDPLQLSLRLSEVPMSAVGTKSHYGIPCVVARELLTGPSRS